MRQLPLVLALLSLIAQPTRAQSHCGKPIQLRAATVVVIDLAAARFATDLPFDEPFIIKAPFPAGLNEIYLTFGRARWVTTRNTSGYQFDGDTMVSSFSKTGVFPSTEFVFNVPALAPDQDYLFRFRRAPFPSAEHYVDVVVKPKSSIANHLHTDFGVMRSLGEAEYWGVTSSVHYYFRPLNKNEGTCVSGGGLDHLLKRLSLFGGFSVLKIHSEAELSAPYAVGSPIVGIGIRAIPYLGLLRVNGGVMFFNQDDANPLVTRNRGKRDTFISITADIDLKALLVPLFGAIVK